MQLSLEETKEQLVKDVCGNFPVAVYRCNTEEDLQNISREYIQKIASKTLIGDQQITSDYAQEITIGS